MRTIQRRRRLLLATAVLALFCVAPSGQDLVVRGGKLFDGVGDHLVDNPGLVIVGGVFRGLEANAVAEDAPVLQLTDDDCILPGLVDVHAHFNVQVLGLRRSDEVTVNPVLLLANGVTTAFPAGEYDPERMHELGRRLARGEQVGPRLVNSGPYFGSARRGWNRKATREDIDREVDLWAERGVGGFKAKGIGRDHLRWLVERAHLHGLTVTAHLDSGFRGSVNPKEAILLGVDRIEHFLGGDSLPATRSAYASLEDLDVDDPRVDEIIDLFVTNGTWFDATMSAYGYFGEKSEIYDYWVDERAFFTPEVREYLEANPRRTYGQFEKIFWVKRKTLKKFYAAGGRITLGTDHPSWGEFVNGFAAHREMDAMVRAGLPPADVLKIASINGARALGLGDSRGTIEPGKLADFFVIEGDPLTDIRATRTVHTVVKGGVVYDTRELLAAVRGTMTHPEANGEAR